MDLTKFEGHTPGPWQWTDATMPQRLGMIVSGTRCVMAFGDDEKYEETCGTPPVDADRALVLAAPELLEEVTRLRAKVEELRGAMRSLEFCVMTWTSVDEQYRCPSCWRTEDDGHFASCRLDAALNDARKGEGE